MPISLFSFYWNGDVIMNDRNIMMTRAQFMSLGLGTYYNSRIRRHHTGDIPLIPNTPYTRKAAIYRTELVRWASSLGLATI